MKRAINSVGLNAGEPLGAALSMRTVRLPERVAREADSVDRIVAILYKLAYRPT